MAPFAAGRPPFDFPPLTAERHLNDTLEKHAVVGPEDPDKYELFRESNLLLGGLKRFQSRCVETGQAKATAEAQEALEALERARGVIARD